MPVIWSGSNHLSDAAMDLNYFLPKMIQALNHHLVLYKTRNSSEYLELLKSEMCSMNVGEGVFVSALCLNLVICDGNAEYGTEEMTRTGRCERGGLEGFEDLMCG